MSVEDAKEFIAHYGVKGMRWGVRKQRPLPTPTEAHARAVVTKNKHSKSKIKTAGGENHPPHEDAVKAALSRQKLKKSGTVALSNKELEDLANRMNLEQRIRDLESKRPKSAGKEFVESLTKDPAKTAKGAKDLSETAANVATLFGKRK